jgi:ABC-2 type transport system permease protein
MKILATVYKEFLTLIRDPGGMAMIFIMPVALVTVMAFVQDAPFRSYTEYKLDILCIDDDNDTLGKWIEQSLTASGNFKLVKEYEGKTITRDEATQLVNDGRFKAMIYIPHHATKNVSAKTALVVQALMAGFGVADKPAKGNRSESVNIQLSFDPVIEMNVKEALLFAVEKIVAGAENRLLVNRFSEQVKNITGTKDTALAGIDMSQMVGVSEKKTSAGFDSAAMNSVQHNVPAWTMFAMFFIVFPLAGNFIKEREDGSLLRLRLIAGSQFYFIAGKYLFYFLICLLQFVLMMGVGLYLLPLMGLSKLIIGGRVFDISIAAVCIALAATAFGMVVATAFRTHHQALAFGSVAVVLLAAIGGVWIPVYILPHTMQVISGASPLSWGLELCNDIFLRSSSFRDLLPNISRLLAFTACCLGLSYFFHSRRMIS